VLEALAELPSPASIGALAERLRDPHEEVRLAATRVLGDIDDDRTLGPLLRAAGDHSDDVQEAARVAVLSRRSVPMARALVEALGDPALRDASIGLLAATKDVSVGMLVEAAEHAEEEARGAIGEALRAADAEGGLVESLEDPDPDVRYRAVLGLRALEARTPASGPGWPAPWESWGILAPRNLSRGPLMSDPDMAVAAAIEPALRRLADAPASHDPPA
jgi:HEAT repeat protein